jgi:hypothetical protein
VKRVGEGIQLFLMKMRYVLILINQVLLQLLKFRKVSSCFEYPDTDITIFGYTDITGPADYNLKLSKESGIR